MIKLQAFRFRDLRLLFEKMNIVVVIPDDVAIELGASETAVAAKVQADLAVHYYEAGLASIGRAAEMSGLRRGDFEGLLADRRSVRNYSKEDWAVDLAWASR